LEKNRKFFFKKFSSIFIVGGEYQMRKGDKGKKVFGVIVILAIIVSVFGGLVSAGDVSGGLTQSVDDAELFDKNNTNPLPLTTQVAGIDVSHHQGNIDWSSVYNSGKKFAFAKSTEGVGFTDPNFDKNMGEAHTAGMLIGAYHYARPDLGNDAADEARYFVSVAGKYLKDGYLRPALDLEEGASLGKAALSNWVHEWMNTVKSETGIEPIIYVYSDYANNYLDNSMTEYNLWIAHWRCDTGTPPNTGIWTDWDFWQYYSPNYCGQNSVPGISGGVDLDIFDGDMSSLYAFVITGGTDDLIPLTGDMYGNGKDITGFYNANTAEFTFGGEAVRFSQMADKLVMSEYGRDTTGTYYASKAGFTFDGKTDDTVNIEFADQGAELGVLSSSSSYDRQAAYNYAMQWWNSCNHECGDYKSCTPWSYWGWECGCGYPAPPHSNGGDCANFVSQCLIAGGHPYLNTGDPCRGYPCGKEEIGAKKLGNCLVSKGWERTCSYHASPPSNIDVGDVLIYHKSYCDDAIAHATIVTYVSGSDVRITCHSVNRKNEPYTYMSTSHPYYEWLHYPSQPTIYPLTGDMYKSGTDATGIYNTGTAEFTFDGKTVNFGQADDAPIIGDWDGDGYDEIGLFRSSASIFYLVTRNWATLPYDVGAADKDIPFSYPEDIPIAGDWDGDGDDDIGGYYPGTFYLYLLNLGSSTATSYRNVPFGLADDIPLIGDWDNDGNDDVAVCRKYDLHDNPTHYFDLDLTGADHEIGPCEWGDNDDIPITGRWNAGSGDKIGVYRPSTEEFLRNYDIPQIQECDGTDTSCGIYPNCENCNNYDGWIDTGNTKWVDENDCREKEQKEQKYRDYYCSGSACTYSETGTPRWIDTGNTQNKPEGTICGCTASNTLKRCYGGVCTDTGICDSTTCGADAACDGKEPGDSCGGGICDSNCKCGAVGEDYGVFSAPWWFVDKNGDQLADDVFGYGFAGATPLVGDFNQDGSDDIAVVYLPWWFVDTNGDHIADDIFGYGFVGGTPLVGDFNQDGWDDIAVVSLPTWFVDTDRDQVADDVFGYGFAGATPMVGDFDQDGKDDIAVVYLPWWFVDTDMDQVADDTFGYGFADATPLIGDFNQDGSDDIAVVYLPWWFVDTDRDQVADDTFGYGFAGATPIVGDFG
jgi:GH25 family lysozyme M1 (1,4-beta-N-acetylmuramidase)